MMEKTERIYKKPDSNLTDADKALLARIEAQFKQDVLDGYWGFDELKVDEELDEIDIYEMLYPRHRSNKR